MTNNQSIIKINLIESFTLIEISSCDELVLASMGECEPYTNNYDEGPLE
ncbi:hypothetical protein [Vagococcus penaei]|nr:hypothetical protein [Vagococcus penaei]